MKEGSNILFNGCIMLERHVNPLVTSKHHEWYGQWLEFDTCNFLQQNKNGRLESQSNILYMYKPTARRMQMRIMSMKIRLDDLTWFSTPLSFILFVCSSLVTTSILSPTSSMTVSCRSSSSPIAAPISFNVSTPRSMFSN